MPTTKILSVNKQDLKQAAQLICDGKLVAFPTETVYGLGANALDKEAVAKIFVAKGRPQDNPLIVHLHNSEQVNELVQEVPETAKKLMNIFWPGPLTLVLKKKDIIPLNVSAGLPTVALRMPNHPIALELLRTANVPIVAPSANISGRPSPTDAQHVYEDLQGKIEAIIDGGRCTIGIESTVVDLSEEVPCLLRKGKISKEELETIIGPIKEQHKSETPKAPGMKYKHYSPQATVIIVTKDSLKEEEQKYQDKKSILLTYNDDEEMARELFKDFRDADKKGYQIIFVKETTTKGFGEAIMDRLKKASNHGN